MQILRRRICTDRQKCLKGNVRQLADEINQFNNNLETIKMQVKELQEDLKDKTKADMLILKSELDACKEHYDVAQEQVRQSEQYLQKVTELKEKIVDAEKSVRSFGEAAVYHSRFV